MIVITDLFIDGIIDATNECGIQIDEFEQTFGVIKKDEAGRSLIRAFISIKWHMGQIENPPTESQLFSYLKSVKIDALTPDFLKFSQPQKLSGENFRRVQEKIEPFLNWSRAKLILYPYFAHVK